MFNFSTKTVVNRAFKLTDLFKQMGVSKEARKEASVIEKITLTNVLSPLTLNCEADKTIKEVYVFEIVVNARIVPELFIKELDNSIKFHTLFNVVCTCIFLPFTKIFVKIATKVIPERKIDKSVIDTLYLDERFLHTPSIAINQANMAAAHMTELAIESMQIAFDGFLKVDENAKDEVAKINDRVSEMEKKIVEYLIKVSASSDLTFAEEKRISAIHHATGDIIRISELSDNITKYTRNCKRDNLEFSEGVRISLSEMLDKIKLLHQKTMLVFDKKDFTALKEVDAIEDEIDALRKSAVKGHISRLNEGKCNPASSGVFINLVGNLERAADHLTYVAHCFDDAHI